MKRVIASLAIGMLIGSATVAAAAPNTVQATIAKFKILVDGETKTGTTNQLVYNGTTYVPIREVGGLLAYETKYDGQLKQIEFISTDKVSGEWISLYEFEVLNNLQIVGSKEVDGSYKVVKGLEDIFSFNTSELKDGDESATTSKSGNIIRFKKHLGSTLLNKEDLKKSGFKI